MKVRTLKASILRLMGQDNSAFLTESLAIDPLYMGLLYEKALHEDSMENFHTVMREEAHNYLRAGPGLWKSRSLRRRCPDSESFR